MEPPFQLTFKRIIDNLTHIAERPIPMEKVTSRRKKPAAPPRSESQTEGEGECDSEPTEGKRLPESEIFVDLEPEVEESSEKRSAESSSPKDKVEEKPEEPAEPA